MLELIIAALAAVIIVALYTGALLGPALARRRLVVRRRIIVNLKTGKAFEGVVVRRAGGYLVLRSATLHEEGTTRPVDGEILVEADDVDFIQAPPA